MVVCDSSVFLGMGLFSKLHVDLKRYSILLTNYTFLP